MKKILAFLLLALAFPALGQRVTLTVTVTNRAVTTNSLTIGSAFRYFTNAQSSTTFATNLTSINATKTNVFNQIAAFPYTAITLQDVGTNSFRLVASASSLASALGGTWGYITTNSGVGPSNSVPMIYPFSTILGTTNQTNQGSAIVDGLSNYTTNSVSTNAISLGNYLTKGASTQQVVIGSAQFNGTLRAAAVAFTNGFTSALTNINPVTSNLVNHGNAIRSGGPGGNSFQLGSNAWALGTRSTAIGNGAFATNTDSMAIGTSAIASNLSTIAIGVSARAYGDYAVTLGQESVATNEGLALGFGARAEGLRSIAVGVDAVAYSENSIAITRDSSALGYGSIVLGHGAGATKINSMAIGQNASATHSNSTAIGQPDHAGTAVATGETNQVRLGTANHTVSIPGQLLISGTQSNTTFRGTNIAAGSWSFPRFDLTTLGAGNNLAVPVGTNRFIRFGAGPASAATIVGMVGGATTGGLDGQDVVAFNDTGYGLTFAVNSVDPVPANRINTPSGADISIPDQGWAQFIYDGTDARWKMLNAFSGTNLLVTTTTTNAIYAVMTNGVLVSGAATNLNIIVSTANAILATNTSGKVDMQIVLSAGSGEANVNGEVSVTNATMFGLVNGKAGVTNLLRSIAARNGLVGTNESGTNISLAIDPAVVASQANITAMSNTLVTVDLGKVDELNGVATNLTIYTGSPGLTIWQLPGAATNSWQVMRTNGGFPIAFVSSNDVLNASNAYFRGKFTNVAPVHLESFLYVTGAQTNNSGITIENDTGLTITTGAGVITHNGWNGSRAVVSGAAKELAESSVTSTELGYLSGVTSALQTQLNTKTTTQMVAAAIGSLTVTNSVIIPWQTLAANLHMNGSYSRWRTNLSSGSIAVLVTNLVEGVTYRLDVDATGGDGTSAVTWTGLTSPGAAYTNTVTTYLVEKVGTTTNVTRSALPVSINFGIGLTAFTNSQALVTVSNSASSSALPTSPGPGAVLRPNITGTPYWHLDDSYLYVNDSYKANAARDGGATVTTGSGGASSISLTPTHISAGGRDYFWRLSTTNHASGIAAFAYNGGSASRTNCLLRTNTFFSAEVAFESTGDGVVTNFDTFIGIGTAVSGRATSMPVACGFMLKGGVTDYLQTICSFAGSTTTNILLLPITTNAWYTLGFQGSSNSVVFYTNGVAAVTNTANLPVGASMTPAFNILNVATNNGTKFTNSLLVNRILFSE